jgi:hypothetical protein
MPGNREIARPEKEGAGDLFVARSIKFLSQNRIET